MSEPLITQLDTELPIVLIIKDKSDFSDVVVSALKTSQLELKTWESSTYLDWQQLKKILNSPRLFRVVLVAEAETTAQDWWEEFELHTHLQQGYAVVNGLNQSHAENLSLLLLRDIFSAKLAPWKHFLNKKKQEVNEYHTTLYPLALPAVKQSVLRFIAHPHPAQVQVVQGSSMSSSSLAQHLLRMLNTQYHQVWSLNKFSFQNSRSVPVVPTVLENTQDEADLAADIISWMKKQRSSSEERQPVRARSPLFAQPELLPQKILPQHFPKTVTIPTLKPPVITKSVSRTATTQTVETKQAVTRPKLSAATENFEDEQDFEVVLHKLFQTERVQQKEAVVKKLTTTTVKTTHRNAYRRKLYALSLAVVAAILFVSGCLVVSLVSFAQIRATTLAGQPAATWTKTWLKWLTPSLQMVTQHLPLSGLEADLDTTQTLLSFQDQQQQLRQTEAVTENFLALIFTAQPGNVFDAWKTVMPAITTAYQQTSLVEAHLKNTSLSLPPTDIAKLKDRLAAERRNLVAATQLQSITPTLLAKDGKRTYAVLLTDTAELRPMGGKILAVGFVELANGKVSNTWVRSASEVEARFPGQLAAPEFTQALFSKKQWNFSDTLWEPSLSASSREVTGVLQSIQANQIDGLVVLPVTSLGKLVAVTGPLSVEGTSYAGDQLAAQLLKKSVTNSEPVYSATLQTFFDALKNLPADKFSPLLSQTTELLNNQELALFSTNDSEEAIFETLGWSGELLSPACPAEFNQQPCVVDPYFQLEANVGNNKANEYVKRTMNHTISLSSTGAHHTQQTTFYNVSPSATWPYGNYIAEIQVFLAPDAILDTITVNGTQLPADTVLQTSYQGRKEIVFPLTVPVAKTTSVVVSYDLPFSEASSFLLHLF